jgi:hypothetical protein
VADPQEAICRLAVVNREIAGLRRNNPKGNLFDTQVETRF